MAARVEKKWGREILAAYVLGDLSIAVYAATTTRTESARGDRGGVRGRRMYIVLFARAPVDLQVYFCIGGYTCLTGRATGIWFPNSSVAR